MYTLRWGQNRAMLERLHWCLRSSSEKQFRIETPLLGGWRRLPRRPHCFRAWSQSGCPGRLMLMLMLTLMLMFKLVLILMLMLMLTFLVISPRLKFFSLPFVNCLFESHQNLTNVQLCWSQVDKGNSDNWIFENYIKKILGDNFLGEHFFGWKIFLVKIFFGDIFLGENFLGENFF